MLQLFLGAVIISFSAVFVKLAQVSSGASAFYRALFGAAALAAALTIGRGWKTFNLKLVLGGLACGLFFCFDLWSWHASIHYIGPGQATVLGNFQVFFLTLAAVVFTRTRPRPMFLLALFLALSGLYLMVGMGWGAQTPQYRTGVLLGLLTAVFYTLFLLTLKQTVSGTAGPTAVMTAVSLSAAAIMSLLMLANGDSFAIPDGKSLLVLLAYGVLCQGLGWFLISTGLRQAPAALAGLTLLLQPALSYVWDVVFFAKPVTPVELSGAMLALAAIYLGSTKGR